MSAHTPGPWTLKANGDVVAGDRRIASVQNGGIVCLPDARLIVAAPYLLAALRRLIAVDDAHADFHAPDGDDIKRMVEHAEAHKHARAVVIKALWEST